MEHRVTEEFISMSLNPESGRYVVPGNYLTYGIVGALLMDLSLAGMIKIDEHKVIRDKPVTTTGIAAYDRMLNQISGSSGPKKLAKWVRRFGNKSAWYRKEMQKYFVKQGILKVERRRIRKRLLEMVKDNPFAHDISKTIIEMQAAITAAIAATAAMSAASSASGN